MKQINIVYEDDFSDVDIILVPDIVAENLEEIGMIFLSWAEKEESDCWHIIEGRKVCSVDTEDFMRWIDKRYFNSEHCKTSIVKQHTTMDVTLPIVEF